jgi:hypothetical protein
MMERRARATGARGAVNGPVDTFVLQEFRLRAADSAGEAARIVGSFDSGTRDAIPLLVSISDKRDVATVRALRAGDPSGSAPLRRVALAPLVATWQAGKRYGTRIDERDGSRPAYFRMAVTESGINNGAADPLDWIAPRRGDEATTPIRLLWIGKPQDTHAGLLVLLGTDDRETDRPDAGDWPLPLSDSLGVRIYESRW